MSDNVVGKAANFIFIGSIFVASIIVVLINEFTAFLLDMNDGLFVQAWKISPVCVCISAVIGLVFGLGAKNIIGFVVTTFITFIVVLLILLMGLNVYG